MRFIIALYVTIGVLVLHGLALAFQWYELFAHTDTIMHGLGGFAMGLFGLALWYEGIEEIRFKKSFERLLKWWILPLFVVGFVAIIGIVWEWHEFVLDVWRPVASVRQPSIPDTMMDYFMDLFGAVISILVGKKRV